MLPPPPSPRNPAGFSLVETVLAVGIVATVLLSIVGLIPIALDGQKDAVRISTEARIVQAFVGELQLCDWDQLDTTFNSETERTRYFDDQGTRVEPGAGDYIYSARVYLLPSHGPDLASVELPGDGAASLDRPEHLRRITIHITAVPGAIGEALLDNPEDRKVRTYATNIVNLRKR